jgi:hypothetical protein
MKRLYARLVLWLIRPALELKDRADRVVLTQVIKTAGEEARAEIRRTLSRRD